MSWFSKNKIESPLVDLHSHLIPGIDDGVRDLQQSFEILSALGDLGYQKVITTPHIHPRYPNSAEIIISGLEKVQKFCKGKGLKVEVEAAAEYFVDEVFQENLDKGQPLLSFGNRHVLVETSFVNRPFSFEHTMQHLLSKGYHPILAHPERYQYLEGEIDWLLELKDMGVSLQVTLSSFIGYYGEMPKKVAQRLLKGQHIDFFGSDLHRISQVKHLMAGLKLSRVQRYLKASKIGNHELL